MKQVRIIMGADPFGVEFKNTVQEHLDKQGYEIVDISGPDGLDYVEVGKQVGKAISEKKFDRGFIFCGSGMGVNIVANKFKGVYCGLCESVTTARLCRIINNCNVLSMGGLITGKYRAVQMADAFMNATFTEGFDPADPAFLKDAYERVQKTEQEL